MNKNNQVSIIPYSDHYKDDLLRLLLLLHRNYFFEHSSGQVSEMSAELDMEGTYRSYVQELELREGDSWRIFLAVADSGPVGFIIGSFMVEEGLVYANVGKVEDWFMAEGYRGAGAGLRLYQALEAWFKEKECDQVISDTWHGNDSSIKAHTQAGFFISGVMFGKKLR